MHSPHYPRQRDRAAVAELAERFDLSHPLYIDHDRGLFEALGAVYWPTFVLVDKRGHVRTVELGEMRAGTPAAERFERQLRALLAES